MRKLRVLVVDDLHSDALLVVEELRRQGFDVVFERVDTLEQLAASLARPWDVVISDHATTHCTALSALAVVHDLHLDLPFIIVAKANGDLARLAPAVERELRAAAQRSAHRRLAHDINNPLAGLIANLDMVAAEMKSHSELHRVDEPLQAARGCADRIRELVRSLLPSRTADTGKFPPAQSATVSSSRARLLIVDDEAVLVKAMGRMLAAELEVQAVTRGRDAIERIRQGERFDVILCDLMMPDVTGMEVHDELSRLVPEQAERMIFMTGGVFTPRAQQFLERVRDRCIDKPFDLGQLKALVHERLRGSDD